MIWNTATIQRIILDTAGAVLQTPHAGLGSAVPADLDLHHDLGLNSLQRMTLAASLNEFFGLFRSTADNYLLAHTSLAHWTACILRARQQDDTSLTFRTSGTSGAARAIQHPMASLLGEAHFLTKLLPRPALIVSTVPAQHVYGLIWTVLLPAIWECPLRLLADVLPDNPGADTLIIGTPFTWEFMERSLRPGSALTCRGVSSTAPLPPGLFDRLTTLGIPLTDVYGSSETGGLAYRHHPDQPFNLFPYLSLSAENPAQITRSDTGATYRLPDRLEQLSPRQIRVLGRLDGAVQIAGVNVYPAHIRQTILDCPLVLTCDIYAKADAGVAQLYGAVQLRTHTEANRAACLHWIRARFSAPQIPKHLYIY